MNHQNGGIRFSSLLIVAIIIYGAFVAVKFVGANMMETQIAKEIEDAFGMSRGAEFTESDGVTLIREALAKHDVIFDPEDENAVSVNIDKENISFSYTYKVIIDCIFFKKEKVYVTKRTMKAYG